MSLAIEGRIRAIGVVGFTVPGTPAWLGRHPGFDDAIVDGGAGITTVTLDGSDTPGGQLCLFCTPIGAVGWVAASVAPTNARAVVINAFSAAGVAVDSCPFMVMAVEIPAQS